MYLIIGIVIIILLIIYFWMRKPAAAPIVPTPIAPVAVPTEPVVKNAEPEKFPLYDWNGTYANDNGVFVVTAGGDKITIQNQGGPSFDSQYLENNNAGFMLFFLRNQGTEIILTDPKSQSVLKKMSGNTNPVGIYNNVVNPPTNSPWNGKWTVNGPENMILELYRQGNLLYYINNGILYGKLPINSNNEVTLPGGEFTIFLDGDTIKMARQNGETALYATRII